MRSGRRELPECYPPYQTCHRRFQQWIRSGNLDEAFVDATFASAKKGDLPSVRHAGAKASRSSPSPQMTVLPLAVSVESAGPAECRLVEGVLGASFLDELPARLVGDKAYDSDALDEQLRTEYGIELIAPNRRRRSKIQDGRPLRRYRRRWKVERLFSWLHNFRRLVASWESAPENFLGFVQLGCLKILLRYL